MLKHAGLKIDWRVGAALGVALTLALLILLLLPASAKAPPVLPYVITDTAGGGQCALIGTWDDSVKTCTLNQDISSPGTQAIDLASDHVRLDGAGHTITGDGTNAGVFTDQSYNQVMNIVIDHFYIGAESYSASNNRFSNLTVSNANQGITLYSTTSGAVDNSTTTNSSVGIFVQLSSGNLIENNRLTGGNTGIGLSGAAGNTFRFNLTSSNNMNITIYGSSNANWFHDNSIVASDGAGLDIHDSNSNVIYNNNFLSMVSPANVWGTSSGNLFDFGGVGNYWDTFATAAQGCLNSDNNRYCDSAYSHFGVTDNYPLARRSYFFTWYDNLSPGSQDWILMANPSSTVNDNAWFDLSIGGSPEALGFAAANQISAIPGEVKPQDRITPSFPGVRNGPVEVGYHAAMRQMVSQRILWGNSLEEVTGIDAGKLSSIYYWPWYDQQSPGYSNWLLVANPSSSEDVWVKIMIGGVAMQDPGTGNDYFIVPHGGEITPSFPGHIGGPVEVRAIVHDGSWTTPSDFRKVFASQRVLSGNGGAFNEVPGIPVQDLSYHYFWTWYDQQTPGAQNWILVANPATLPDGSANTNSMDYDILIAGYDTMPGAKGTLAPGEMATPTFPGMSGGPVQVDTRQHGTGSPGTPMLAIVSERSMWGPSSFEEVPGLRYLDVGTDYYWTWYDMATLGSANWVLVANPTGSVMSTFHIYIGDTDVTPEPGTGNYLYPGDVKTYTFPGIVNGPVHVTFDNPGIASQRVLWQGNFNEVLGTPLG